MFDRILNALRNTQSGRPPRSLAKSWSLHLERLEDRALMAADANLVAFRPVTDYINYALHPVVDTLESDPQRGPGIRVDGDDDNANGVADYLDKATAASGDNDLVRVDALGTGTSFSVAWTGSLAVWSSPTKAIAIVNGATIAEDQSLWVEYTSQTQSVGSSTALTLTVTDGTTTATDNVVFHSFKSVVIAIGGNTQDPSKVGDPNLGTFTMGATLYDQGYDVHLYAHNQVSSTGKGAAYDEVVSAVLKRNVDNVAIFGYSWGGGATYDLTNALSTTTTLAPAGYKLQYTAYVDGIRHGSLSAETRKPVGTAFHDNYFQRKDWLLKGNTIAGASNTNVTLTAWGKSLVHTTIDDSSTLQSLLVGNLVARVGV
jgi:hypothetical protein